MRVTLRAAMHRIHHMLIFVLLQTLTLIFVVTYADLCALADTYRTSTIYSPGVSTTGAIDGPPATASRGRSSGGTELHVHVDQQQDGRLSVIISSTEDGVDHMGHMDRVTLMEPGLQGSRRDGSSRQFGSHVGTSQGMSHGHRASAVSVTPADDTNSTSSSSRAGRGGEGYHSPLPAASPSPQWQPPPDNRPVSDDGCSEVASDLSAMGNPMAYSARLCSRLEQHAVPHGSHPASPSGAAEQLERYLDTNQALKQKAGGCADGAQRSLHHMCGRAVLQRTEAPHAYQLRVDQQHLHAQLTTPSSWFHVCGHPMLSLERSHEMSVICRSHTPTVHPLARIPLHTLDA